MSKLIFLEFACQKHGKFESLSNPITTVSRCPVCNSYSSKVISAPRIALEGVSMSFPTAADRWARNHEQAAKIASKRDDES